MKAKPHLGPSKAQQQASVLHKTATHACDMNNTDESSGADLASPAAAAAAGCKPMSAVLEEAWMLTTFLPLWVVTG